jgi:hypothetical protein
VRVVTASATTLLKRKNRNSDQDLQCYRFAVELCWPKTPVIEGRQYGSVKSRIRSWRKRERKLPMSPWHMPSWTRRAAEWAARGRAAQRAQHLLTLDRLTCNKNFVLQGNTFRLSRTAEHASEPFTSRRYRLPVPPLCRNRRAQSSILHETESLRQ